MYSSSLLFHIIDIWVILAIRRIKVSVCRTLTLSGTVYLINWRISVFQLRSFMKTRTLSKTLSMRGAALHHLHLVLLAPWAQRLVFLHLHHQDVMLLHLLPLVVKYYTANVAQWMRFTNVIFRKKAATTTTAKSSSSSSTTQSLAHSSTTSTSTSSTAAIKQPLRRGCISIDSYFQRSTSSAKLFFASNVTPWQCHSTSTTYEISALSTTTELQRESQQISASTPSYASSACTRRESLSLHPTSTCYTASNKVQQSIQDGASRAASILSSWVATTILSTSGASNASCGDSSSPTSATSPTATATPTRAWTRSRSGISIQ